MSDDKPDIKELMERMKEFVQSLGEGKSTSDPMEGLVFPKMSERSPIKWAIDPLRRNIDYQARGRKTFPVEDFGFHCPKCGFYDRNKDYIHSDEECTLHGVMES